MSAAYPRHVAIIMDGNGRWATERGLSRGEGHKVGIQRVEPVVRRCAELGIEALTLYAFSTENWKRPQGEISLLMTLFREFFDQRLPALVSGNVRIRVLGDPASFPAVHRQLIAMAESATKHNTGLYLNIAMNYGAQAEILAAVKSIAAKVASGQINTGELSLEHLEDALYTRGLPMVDLLIRTGGDMRLSNFLLYQCAYAELSFIGEYWPDFTPEVLDRELARYAKKERRFGGLTT